MSTIKDLLGRMIDEINDSSDAIGELSGQKIDTPSTAQVGQTIVVKSVDENGKPTEWECADMASGGTQPDWNQNDETASDYVNNRPFYEEIIEYPKTSDFAVQEGLGFVGLIGGGDLSEGDVVECKFDNSIYNLTTRIIGDVSILGNGALMGVDDIDTDVPFLVADTRSIVGSWTILPSTSGEHSFEWNNSYTNIKQIDNKYIPIRINKYDRDGNITETMVELPLKAYTPEEVGSVYWKDYDVNDNRYGLQVNMGSIMNRYILCPSTTLAGLSLKNVGDSFSFNQTSEIPLSIARNKLVEYYVTYENYEYSLIMRYVEDDLTKFMVGNFISIDNKLFSIKCDFTGIGDNEDNADISTTITRIL